MFNRFWEQVRGEQAQGVSEYAVLLVLLVLIVVAMKTRQDLLAMRRIIRRVQVDNHKRRGLTAGRSSD